MRKIKFGEMFLKSPSAISQLVAKEYCNVVCGWVKTIEQDFKRTLLLKKVDTIYYIAIRQTI